MKTQNPVDGVSLLFKNSASLPFAKDEERLHLPCLEFIKASNMINNLYTWIIQKKKRIKAKELTTLTFTIPAT